MQPFSNPSVHSSTAVFMVRISSNAVWMQKAVTRYLVAACRKV